ncbi:hypothetical protein [Solemya velum gill symbiont]|uniref:Uncharacterized protein n=1 Tax=Solemya velum gill symbiont TaxID=2340 RepID=A0A0B0H608_SOVGS|nr:hypothetical protein [Solemya velum gill symbiont]KHF24545.1 hypothetical protein JV46_28880 [Solemya velum gill symbiont]OOY35309.1 hypothetical protein BOV88_05075 [Solemya velum gill symbiont]OOY38100.1 hypothetical protein BOV89_04475 [Solemya velum gill symbiont]OOY41037.1 hypothetical protein BOV90_00745 [Solemya velum gill symbiont]OOY41251.1 hypothetical protein BOV91_12470 [Solemya velum gill symbiont]
MLGELLQWVKKMDVICLLADQEQRQKQVGEGGNQESDNCHLQAEAEAWFTDAACFHEAH